MSKKGRRSDRFTKAPARIAAGVINRFLVEAAPIYTFTDEYKALKLLAGARRASKLNLTQIKLLGGMSERLRPQNPELSGAIRCLLTEPI